VISRAILRERKPMSNTAGNPAEYEVVVKRCYSK
jgi:hypothetical protein